MKKKPIGVFLFQKNRMLDNFIKHKPLISEEYVSAMEFFKTKVWNSINQIQLFYYKSFDIYLDISSGLFVFTCLSHTSLLTYCFNLLTSRKA